MSTIVFFIDSQEGHFIPTFTLAHSLKDRGHNIIYLGIADCEKSVTEHGFAFKAFAQKNYPKGYVKEFKNLQAKDSIAPRMYFLESLGREFQGIVKAIKPDIFIVSTYLSLEALLIKYAFNIKVIILTTHLVSNSDPQIQCWNTILSISSENKDSLLIKKLSKLGEPIYSHEDLYAIVSRLNSFIELIACPKEFDLPNAVVRKNNNITHIGPSVSKNYHPTELLSHIQPGKKVIYAAMGSQTARFLGKCDLVYKMLIDLMTDSQIQNYHLVLSLGELDTIKPGNISENVTAFKWAPQIEILNRAAVMITHGGLGTVKECIFYGVPMIVVPDGHDQPVNADRVEYHNLGKKVDIAGLTKQQLKDLLLDVMNSSTISDNVKKMREIFHDAEKMMIGERIIETELQEL